MGLFRSIHWNKQEILKNRSRLFALLALSLSLFPSVHTAKVELKPTQFTGIPQKVDSGSPLFNNTQAGLYLNSLKFTNISGTNEQFSIVSVYSPKHSRVHQIQNTHPNWRENIRNWFRAPRSVWSFQDIEITKIELTEAKDLRLPSQVVERLKSADEDQIKEERRLVRESLANYSDEINTQCFDYPVLSKHVSSYGSPRTLPSGKQYYHLGLDMRAWTGTPIKAMGDGKIVLAQDMIVPGKNVIIDHGGGLFSRYMHFSKFAKQEGEEVKRGDIIGYSGNTGRSQAPHLHFEVIWKGNHASPQSFLQKWEPICDLT